MFPSPRRRAGLFMAGSIGALPRLLLLLLLHHFLLLGPAPVRADDNYGIFATPPRSGPNSFYGDNVAYQLGTSLQLVWQTGMPSYQLNLWQQNLPSGGGATGSRVVIMNKSSSAIEPGGTTWRVQTYDLNLDRSNVFFISATEDGDLNVGFTSHYFNITRDPVLSSTTGSTPGPTETHPPPQSTSSHTSPPSSSDPDAGLKIGLGVGLGVGLPVVAVAAFFAAYASLRRRDRGPSQPLMQSPPGGGGGGGGGYYGYPPPQQQPYAIMQTSPAQLDATPRTYGPSELHGDSGAYK